MKCLQSTIFAFLYFIVSNTHAGIKAEIKVWKPDDAVFRNIKIVGHIPDELLNTLASDLRALESIRGNGGTQMHHRHFGSVVSGETYANFTHSRIKYVWFEEESTARKGTIATFMGGILLIGRDYFSLPLAKRLGALIHEAAHSDFPELHADCDGSGFKRTEGDVFAEPPSGVAKACDKEPGSYAVAAVFLANLVRHCTNCTQSFRDDALAGAKESYGRLLDPVVRVMYSQDLQ